MHVGFILSTPFVNGRAISQTSRPLCPQLVQPKFARRHLAWRCASTDESDDDTEHDIPKSNVDWNNEWSKFQQSGMRSMAPKGREPLSKEEQTARKVVGTLRSTANRVGNKVPTRQQLFGDWRFWVAIILTLSLFSAFVQSSSPVGSGAYGSI